MRVLRSQLSARISLGVKDFISDFANLGHKSVHMFGTHGFRISCSQCKVLAAGEIFLRSYRSERAFLFLLNSPASSRFAPLASVIHSKPHLQWRCLSGPPLPAQKSSLRVRLSGLRMSCVLALLSASLPSEPPLIGQFRLHPIYRLEHCRGVILCTQCGFYSVNRARELNMSVQGTVPRTLKST